MSRQGYITLPIFVVLATVAFLYYSTVFLVIDEWMGLRTAAGLGNAIVFTFLTLMAVGNYCIAVFRDPGRVPSSFMPDVEEAENQIHEIKRKGGDLRFCQKCSHYKPPRTHHCRVCKRCVLRMDHHCVWINNCVGHENYKVFIIFVLYGVIACIHSMVLFVGNFIHDAQKDQPQSSYSNKTTCIIGGAILFPLALALSVLLGWHIYLILQNKTTIEYHEGVRAMWLAEKVGNMYRHPYDLGVYENLVSLLRGKNIPLILVLTASLCIVALIANILLKLPFVKISVTINFLASLAMLVIFVLAILLLLHYSSFYIASQEVDDNRVLGPNIFCWLCPGSKFKGSGLRFRTAFDLPISTTLT